LVAAELKVAPHTRTGEIAELTKRSLPVFQTILTLGSIQAVAMGFTLVRSKIIAVAGGPASVGAISLIDQVVALVAQISTFSLPFASVKFLSAAHSESHEAFANLYMAFLRVLLRISLLGTGIGIALLVWWPAVLGRELVSYASIAILALLAIPATNLTGLLTNAMAAARRVRASGLYGVINTASLAGLCGAGILFGGLRGYYLGNLVAFIGLVVGGMLYLFRQEQLPIHAGRQNLLQELRRYPKVFSFAAALCLISFTLPVAYLLARYAVLRAQGLEAAGLLQSAMALGLALTAVMRQSNLLFLTPAMNRSGEDTEKFHKAVEFLRALSLAIGIIALPVVLFPDWWLFLLYSRKFLAAAPYVYLFVLAQTLELFAGVNIALLIGLDHIGTQVTVTLTGLAGLAALSWWLVPHYGIAGVAVAIIFDALLVFALSAWRLWQTHRLAIHRAMGWLPFSIALLIGICGAVAARFPGNTARGILIKMGVCAVFGLIGLRTLQSKNTSLLQELLQKTGGN